MHNLSVIEESYKVFMCDLSSWASDNIYFVDLKLLHQLDLLHYRPVKTGIKETHFQGSFQMIESPEKMTMISEEFVIWITPAQMHENPITCTLIALNRETGPHLELVFIASGIYNTSETVLKVLDKFLCDINETERELKIFD